MAAYKECQFYLKGNHCSHRDAPEPRRSACIGKESCGAWEDSILCQAKSESEIIQQAKAEVAREIENFLQMHLYARPDKPTATMKFDDWMKLRKILSKYLEVKK